MARDDEDRDDILAEIEGKAAVLTPFHTYQPGMFGKGRLMLTREHVIERTKLLVAERDTTLRLDRVESVSIITTGNPLLILLGVPTCGLGFILYFLFKYRFLVVHGANTTLVISVKGNVDRYHDFAQDVLDAIERQRRSAAPRSEPAAHAVAERPTGVTDRVAPPADKRTITARCPGCSAEYRVPVGSAGKRFRCQKCSATIEVGEDD